MKKMKKMIKNLGEKDMETIWKHMIKKDSD